jgi:hypothetical protein
LGGGAACRRTCCARVGGGDGRPCGRWR